MAEVSGYAQLLRAIGQALETLPVRRFELAPVDDDFVVHGIVATEDRNRSQDSPHRHTIKVVWGATADADGVSEARSQTVKPSTGIPVDLRYTMRDIERLESEGQARRVDPHRTADGSSLSQVLRCIGAYLNQKCARLLKLVREEDAVILDYETSLGSRMQESFSASGLYDLWVRMYLLRADRVHQ